MRPQTLMLSLVAAVALVAPAAAQSPWSTPGDLHRQVVAEEAYRWKIMDKLRDYRFSADTRPTSNVIEVEIVIARTGRLLDAKIVRSSGTAVLDQGLLDALRKYSPYPALPSEIPGMSATLKLRVVVSAEGR